MSNSVKKTYNKNSYSATTASVVDIVGSYIVEIYYNKLYAEAIEFKNKGKTSSITEGYRHAVNAFVQAVIGKKPGKKAEYYNDFVKGLIEYFVKYTSKKNGRTTNEIISIIVREFVPQDYSDSLGVDQERNVLKNALVTTIREFSMLVINDHIKAIIDHHSEQENIDVMKQDITEILFSFRDQLFHSFIQKNSGHSAKVSKSHLDELRLDLKKISQEKEFLMEEVTKAKKQVDVYKNAAQELLDKFKKLKLKYTSAVQQNETFSAKIKKLEETLATTQAELEDMQMNTSMNTTMNTSMNNAIPLKIEEQVSVQPSTSIVQSTPIQLMQAITPTQPTQPTQPITTQKTKSKVKKTTKTVQPVAKSSVEIMELDNSNESDTYKVTDELENIKQSQSNQEQSAVKNNITEPTKKGNKDLQDLLDDFGLPPSLNE